MVVCVLIPRFQLTVAAGDREELLGQPAALAPEPGREQRVGEVSLAAEAFGVRAGMPLGRRSPAVRSWRSCRPTRPASPTPGSG